MDEFEAHTLEFMEELYQQTPQEYHTLVDEWMKQIIRYDLAINHTSYKKLKNGNYEISVEVKAKRFKTLNTGEEERIAINEPLQIGLFKKHPKRLGKNETPIYLEAHTITKESTLLKIEVDVLPKMIPVDPFLTRVDRVYTNNLKDLKEK